MSGRSGWSGKTAKGSVPGSVAVVDYTIEHMQPVYFSVCIIPTQLDIRHYFCAADLPTTLGIRKSALCNSYIASPSLSECPTPGLLRYRHSNSMCWRGQHQSTPAPSNSQRLTDDLSQRGAGWRQISDDSTASWSSGVSATATPNSTCKCGAP